MQGDTIVFFPKYVTLGGETGASYYSDPYDVTQFNQLDVEMVIASFTPTASAPTLDIKLQQSNDLETWSTLGTPQATKGTGTTLWSASDSLRYVRAFIDNFSATDGMVTLWVKGVARNT